MLTEECNKYKVKESGLDLLGSRLGEGEGHLGEGDQVRVESFLLDG